MIKYKPICASAAWAFGGDKMLHRSLEEEADFSEVKDQYHVLGILVGFPFLHGRKLSDLVELH